MSLNKVILIGNVGRDPEIRNLPNDTMVARFSLATSERFRLRSGEFQEQTEWHNIVCWRALAELAERSVRKGSRLYVEGKIRSNSWNDKVTGEKRHIMEIYADNIILLDRAGDASGRERATSPAHNSEKIAEVVNESILIAISDES